MTVAQNTKRDSYYRTFFVVGIVAAILLCVCIFITVAYKTQLGFDGRIKMHYVFWFLLGVIGWALLIGSKSKAIYKLNYRLLGTLKITGPIVMPCLAIFIAYKTEPKGAFDYSISLQEGKKGLNYPKFEDGKLQIRLGNKWESTAVHEDGYADFKGIPGEFRGEKVQVRLIANFWKLDVDSIVVDDTSPTLYLHPDSSLRKIFGFVKGEECRCPIINALVESMGETTYTDSVGDFELIMPLEKQQFSYLVNIHAENYQSSNGTSTPSTNQQLPIFLKKEEK